MPFIREITQNSIDSHQTSPGYCLTFLRFDNVSTFNYKEPKALETRAPMVVTSDAIQVSVTDSKKSMSSQLTLVLKSGDVNYSTALHPGDFVLVNLLNWETDVVRVSNKAKNLQPINEVADGFKGIFKIQSVVKNLSINKNNGDKDLVYTVTAASFTEFNNLIYFNPAIVSEFAQVGAAMWSSYIGDTFQDLLKTNVDIQTILKALFKILIGKSYKDKDTRVKNYGNAQFQIPTSVGQLLGRPKIQYVNEMYSYVLGVWGDSKNSQIDDGIIGPGFNPQIKQDKESNYFKTNMALQGNKDVSLENWNNQTAWSIIQSYTNPALNEMYTTHRVGTDNRIHPTIIVRQKPFTTDHFVPPNKFPVSRYMQLPRWKISADLLYDLQVSTNEAARYNFVQVFTRQLADTTEQNMAQQIQMENFVLDKRDITRHGLKPYVVTSNFDFPSNANKEIRARPWAQIVSDWIIDGHLKESGVMTFVGLQDPIAVGDNIELDNIVYHIESVNHQMTFQSNGKKDFTTRISVSYGMDVRSSKAGPVYPNTEFVSAEDLKINDYNNERILPQAVNDSDSLISNHSSPEPSYTPKKLRQSKNSTTKQSNTGFDPKHGRDDSGVSRGRKK